MIKFSEAELTSVLPPVIKNDCDVQAISYAFQMAMKKVIQFSVTTSLYANIDKLNADLLDLMALELGTQYYDENMDIQTKRKLVKNTLAWYKKAGTPSAVEELIGMVFGEGGIEEWYNYGGEPFRFKILTNALLTPEMNALFSSMIRRVKNTRSWLETIEIHRTAEQTVFAGTGAFSRYKPQAIIDGYKAERDMRHVGYSGTAAYQSQKPAAVIDGFAYGGTAVEQVSYAGTAALSARYRNIATEQEEELRCHNLLTMR